MLLSLILALIHPMASKAKITPIIPTIARKGNIWWKKTKLDVKVSVNGKAEESTPKTELIIPAALPVENTTSPDIARDTNSFVKPNFHSILKIEKRSIETPIYKVASAIPNIFIVK